MLKEITEKEFLDQFPDKWIQDENNSFVYLDDGTILDKMNEWNGEVYTVDGVQIRPVYKQNGEDDFEVIGYERGY